MLDRVEPVGERGPVLEFSKASPTRTTTPLSSLPLHPGRLPAIAASGEQDLTMAREIVGNRHIIEKPSAAELAVLRCLAASLSRREIGVRLYISLNTVKTHIRELYRKLDVTSRADAVTRAEALGLLDRPESPG